MRNASACVGKGQQNRAKLHPADPLERPNKEAKRRADVAGILPSEQPVIRLIGAVLPERNGEWQLQRRCMQAQGMAGPIPPTIDGEATPFPPAQITPKAA